MTELQAIKVLELLERIARTLDQQQQERHDEAVGVSEIAIRVRDIADKLSDLIQAVEEQGGED